MGHYRMATTRNNAGIAHENGSMESARTLRSPLVPEGSTDGMHAALAAAGYDAIMVTEIEVDQSFRILTSIGSSDLALLAARQERRQT